jgi:hypothetical protein
MLQGFGLSSPDNASDRTTAPRTAGGRNVLLSRTKACRGLYALAALKHKRGTAGRWANQEAPGNPVAGNQSCLAISSGGGYG